MGMYIGDGLDESTIDLMGRMKGEKRGAVEGENARRKKRRVAGVKAEEKKRRAKERRAANVRATKRLTVGELFSSNWEKLYEIVITALRTAVAETIRKL
ncbi:hypothetical protein Sjap_004653 [Stephania japonica]|uniref:Uncharacterized protein n=1 Tax=Stephania japonica TaxID=461633 RepID=A0AAP0K4Y3_9MAGN